MARRLYELEWVFLLEAIYHMNEARSVDELRNTVLERLCQLTGCSKAFFQLADVGEASAPTRKFVAAGVPEEVLGLLETKEYRGDPFAMSLALAREPRVMLDTDYVPDECRKTSEFYCDVFVGTGSYYALRAFLVQGGAPLGCIVLLRSQDQGNFTDKDERFLEILSPHMTQKLRYLLPSVEADEGAHSPSIDLEMAKRWRLSEREIDVANLAAAGLSDKEIAERLCISVSTLKKHLSNIYRKMGVSSRIKMLNALRHR